MAFLSPYTHLRNYAPFSPLVYPLTTLVLLPTLSHPSTSYSPSHNPRALTQPLIPTLLVIPRLLQFQRLKELSQSLRVSVAVTNVIVLLLQVCTVFIPPTLPVKSPSQITALSQISQAIFCFLSPTHHKLTSTFIPLSLLLFPTIIHIIIARTHHGHHPVVHHSPLGRMFLFLPHDFLRHGD